MSEHDQPHPAWHAESVESTRAALDAPETGLTGDEAAARLQRHGPNRLPKPRRRGPMTRFLVQFHNVLIYVLLAAALVTLLLGHWADTAVIFGVVVVNALIGFIQEGKAEQALEAIRNLLSEHAVALRGGERVELPAEELVPGDTVLLQPGDKVPADLRLVRVRSLRVEEAALTGESQPVEKSTEPVTTDAAIGDRTSMAYSSTLVTYGQATGVVVATGADTEIGRINTMLAAVETLTTPLLRQIERFGRTLTFIIVALAGLTFAFGTLGRGYTTDEMFLAAVGLAVAAIPEGLPAIITITLAIGVQAMARRHAIIRRLPAVETLGSVSVICTDKTGTLTRNEMTAQSVATAEAMFAVSGVGYDPHGGFAIDGQAIAPEGYPALQEIARAVLLCNDARLLCDEDGRWRIQGDPTEGALLTLGAKAGLDGKLLLHEFTRTDAIPFESEHRFMASLHHDHAGHGFVVLKGAPERVLEMCSRQRQAGEDVPLDPRYWHQQAEDMAARGQRLLAIAFRAEYDQHQELRFEDVECGLTLLGLVGLIDPPREEAVAAVSSCRSAGIRVKMITGDHATTARAIGDQMGIGDGHHAVTSRELETMAPDVLRRTALESDVFARASPEDKLRLVEALQSADQVVAMTGDGVNDAPALRRADVGVAMGVNGTEVAKEAAEMVLTDDNFASIAHAVEEGRTVYDNIKKSILFILPTNGGEALTIIGAIALGQMLPITPLQILWVNMITAVTLALALAFEPAEHNVMRRPPRDPGEPLLSRFLIWRITFVSLVLVAGTFGLFLWERAGGAGIDEARTIAVNTLVLFEIFYLFNIRYILEPATTREGLTGNRYALLAVGLVLFFQVVFTYAPPFQALFGTTAITAFDWGKIVLVTFTVFLLVELEKAVVRRHLRRTGRA